MLACESHRLKIYILLLRMRRARHDSFKSDHVEYIDERSLMVG